MNRFGVRIEWRKYLYECTPFGYVSLCTVVPLAFFKLMCSVFVQLVGIKGEEEILKEAQRSITFFKDAFGIDAS